jgi:hypothetical protein
MKSKSRSALILSLLIPAVLFSAELPPECISDGKAISINNETVLNWKKSTPNQFHGRGRVEGAINAVYPDRNGHNHVQIVIGKGQTDTIEVVYNEDFGRLPKLAVGMQAEACGDYITSNAATDRYQASPDGAIVHWVHKNPNRSSGHPNGYLMLDGFVFGQKVKKDPGLHK